MKIEATDLELRGMRERAFSSSRRARASIAHVAGGSTGVDGVPDEKGSAIAVPTTDSMFEVRVVGVEIPRADADLCRVPMSVAIGAVAPEAAAEARSATAKVAWELGMDNADAVSVLVDDRGALCAAAAGGGRFALSSRSCS